MNEPAFPCTVNGSTHPEATGMTLRDYFAAKAMKSMCQGEAPPISGNFRHIASWSYLLADEMLKARNGNS